ncbi:MAG: site-2 protease family protein [Myxococcota bacterium]
MRWSYPVGTLFGIPIRAHGSLLLILGLMLLAFSSDAQDVASWLLPLMLTIALFGSVLIHELGHALAARRYGVSTRQIMLLPIGGVAILDDSPSEPIHELWIALAGPATSLGLAGVTWLAFFATENQLAGHLAVINLALGLFNLIPAFPLDGGRALRAGLASRVGLGKATRWAARLGRGLSTVLIIVGLATGDLLLAIVGLFVLVSATAEARSTMLRIALDSHQAAELMEPVEHIFGASASGEEVAHVLREHETVEHFPVAFGNRILGVVARFGLERALEANHEFPGLHSVLDRAIVTVHPDATLRRAIELMGANGSRVAIVAEGDAIQGVLRMDRLAELLRKR